MRVFSLSSLLLLSLSAVSASAASTSAASASAASTSAAAPRPELREQVRQTALTRLTELAKRAGLRDADIAVVVSPLKPPMPVCDTPFEVSVGEPRQLGRLTLSARCPASGRVTKLTARAQVTATIPVAARDLDARETIAADDLGTARRTLTSLTDTVTRADEAIGRTSRRSLHAGQVLSRRILQAPELIRRGQTVRIVARVGQAEIVNTGIAMQNGAQDDVIRLRVGTRKDAKVVTVRVTGPGTAEPIAQPAPDASR
ncbi:flagellar basal body P-ring formation chaperone FlgA [Burkholderia thailandensis]|uniref:Flagella basal body P-ring formation protein FlgA n=1 Tax=Burkholderia thailandensis (strain ATCC 700388 / DSM 13276 / CCUG 48851 / CIP 106301 / E264) TaxID=271848 RepID=Q2T8W4_BURTA|nr:flagellar basal body P-ring formation chaperone FlgA [Burkholderia thailandensis]ABC35166.1 flagella basal body P-ring formation protein FlgA [Burkholderia thailandensis E264]MCS6469584.1 flagellar basal body P-ring formation chaperone FlgA [Burkholderia thailandensis]MCS6509736.1 flagellar basal body P-ring formation chaperone FlgA [Burkholderia thailandensis]WRS69617.1 flagellar basal body P-ring formation chaperone FlgA [Burkholderia thailandensis]